jgi:hypothetical protein
MLPTAINCGLILSAHLGWAQIWKAYMECTNMCGRTFLEDPLGSDGGNTYRPHRTDKILTTDPDRLKWAPWWVGYVYEDKLTEPVYSVDWEIGDDATCSPTVQTPTAPTGAPTTNSPTSWAPTLYRTRPSLMSHRFSRQSTRRLLVMLSRSACLPGASSCAQPLLSFLWGAV